MEKQEPVPGFHTVEEMKKTKKLSDNPDRQLVAGDVYSRWKKAIRNTKTSIKIFSPYIGKTLQKLLDAKPEGIENKSITVITTFEPEIFLNRSSDLRTIKNLIESGINVKSLSGLHAKVLLADNEKVILGSQNFTARARINKETSVDFLNSVSETKFLKKLLEWEAQSKDIDPDVVDALLAKIKPYLRRFNKILVDLKVLFQELQDNVKAKKEQQFFEQQKALIAEAQKSSPIKFAREFMYVSIEDFNYGEYQTLKADTQDDLTIWRITKEGRKENKELDRLSMYPLLQLESWKMAFVRLGKTRITYARASVKKTQRFYFRELSGALLLHFPNSDPKKCNIIFDLNIYELSVAKYNLTVNCLFTGTSIEIIDYNIKTEECFSPFYKNWPEIAKTYMETNPELLVNEFFKATCRSFTYTELGRDNKNIQEYFGLDWRWHKLSILDYDEIPVLILD